MFGLAKAALHSQEMQDIVNAHPEVRTTEYHKKVPVDSKLAKKLEDYTNKINQSYYTTTVIVQPDLMLIHLKATPIVGFGIYFMDEYAQLSTTYIDSRKNKRFHYNEYTSVTRLMTDLIDYLLICTTDKYFRPKKEQQYLLHKWGATISPNANLMAKPDNAIYWAHMVDEKAEGKVIAEF